MAKSKTAKKPVKATKKPKPRTPEKPAVEFHNFADESGEVLLLKRIPQNRKTHGDFLWPSGIGTVVECPDWNSEPVCGGGLHAWPWGFGLGDGCDYDIIGDVWLVLGAKPEDVVGNLDGGAKCKARRVTIRMDGSFGDAMAKVQHGFASCVAAISQQDSGYKSSSAADGYKSSSAADGYRSRSAADGYRSRSAANGDGSSSAANGDGSRSAANGYRSSSAANGDGSSSAANGDGSRSAANGDGSSSAANGDGSSSAANGDGSSSAANGDGSSSAANGDGSRSAANGYRCSCEAVGENTLAAIAGTGRIRVGERGAFAFAYYTNADGWRFLTGKVGENGIKADTWYVIRNEKVVEDHG